jgi:myo-inositol-1(or 4)-monophosphatase
MSQSRPDDLARIASALDQARAILDGFRRKTLDVVLKAGGDPVTEADRAIDAVLARTLPRPGDGWLSEETADDPARLHARRVWIVDPLDGTREFVQGLPEFCVSIALVEDGVPVAGGIVNPATGETILGAAGVGVTVNGEPACPREVSSLEGAEVLASRTEMGRGGWEAFTRTGFTVRACGSVAYKTALVAAGRTDATWTLVPKHEWDVAAGVALARASGAAVWVPDGTPLRFNQPSPLLTGLAVTAPGLAPAVRALLAPDAPLRT